jgi:hypothetical protein
MNLLETIDGKLLDIEWNTGSLEGDIFDVVQAIEESQQGSD